MADVLLLIEEQRTVLRDTERELAEAMAAKADLEKKIAHLQWVLERVKRLYSLTSTMAQDEATQASRRIPIPAPPSVVPVKGHESNGRPGTVKQGIVDILRENHRQMRAAEIWAVLQKKGFRIQSERPVEVVASTMRASIIRRQGIFVKNGPLFGLEEWHGRGT